MNSEMNIEMNNEINQVVVIKKQRKVKKVKPVPIVVEEPIVEEVVEEQVESNEEDIKVEEEVVEEVVSKDEDEDELAEQERIMNEAKEKVEFLRMKRELKNRSGEFLEKLKVSKNNELEKINEEMEKLQLRKELLEQDIDTLESIDEETDDVMGFLSEHYADFVNNIAFPKKAKGVKVKKEKKENEKQTIMKYDRTTQFANLPEGLVLTLKYKEYSAEFIKTADGLERDGENYVSLNSAGREFYKEVGAGVVSFNAWVVFKTIKNGKNVCLCDYVENE
jgi:hypothetical protein